jgi:hypothetical protein
MKYLSNFVKNAVKGYRNYSTSVIKNNFEQNFKQTRYLSDSAEYTTEPLKQEKPPEHFKEFIADGKQYSKIFQEVLEKENFKSSVNNIKFQPVQEARSQQVIRSQENIQQNKEKSQQK